jgi:hypothetical protein
MQLLSLNRTPQYAQPYGTTTKPSESLACKLQFSPVTLIILSLLGGGIGYGVGHLGRKEVLFFGDFYKKLPMPVQYGLPFIGAASIGLPLLLVKAATKSSCQAAQKANISTYIQL